MAWSDAPPTKAELTQAAWDSTPPTPQELHGADSPGFLEQQGRNIVNNLPMIGGVVGGVLGTPLDAVSGPMGNVAGAGMGGYLGTAAKNLINNYIDPKNAPQTNTQALTQPLVGGVQQAELQAGGELAAPIISAGSAAIGKYAPLSDYLKNLAEKRAVAATGATGAQSAKFAPNTGRELLDRGIVKFGSSPENIAANAQAAMDKSGQGISDVLGELDSRGVTVDRNTVLNSIKSKIASLSGDESQADLVRSLRARLSDIEAQIGETPVAITPPSTVTPDYSGIPQSVLDAPRPLPGRIAQMSDAGAVAQDANLSAANQSGYNPYDPITSVADSAVPISQAENIKRGYQSKVNWKSPNPDVVANNANTSVSDAYRQSVEDSASQADPGLADQFKEDKETYGLLSPVQEAAQKRATQLEQSPHGGLLDIASIGSGGSIGAMIGGPVGAAVGGAAGFAAKAMRPRYASMAAVGADFLGNIVASSPAALGRWAGTLTQAANRGGNSLAATDYVLQQTDPEYRQHLELLKNASDPDRSTASADEDQ